MINRQELFRNSLLILTVQCEITWIQTVYNLQTIYFVFIIFATSDSNVKMQASYPAHCARVLQTQAFHYTYGGSIYASKASQSERAVPSGHGMPLQWPDRPPVVQGERHLPRYILWLGAQAPPERISGHTGASPQPAYKHKTGLVTPSGYFALTMKLTSPKIFHKYKNRANEQLSYSQIHWLCVWLSDDGYL